MKKNKTLFLEAFRIGDILRIGIRNPGDTMAFHEEKTISPERLETRCRETADMLNSCLHKGRAESEAMAKLVETGTVLCDMLLTPKTGACLETAKAEHLVIKIDDSLVHIPWELLYVGDDFLCRRFSTGRMIDAHRSFAKSSGRTLDGPLSMWILANPEGNLAGSEREGRMICDAVDMQNRQGKDPMIYATLWSGSKITADAVSEKIRNHDFVHYPGHAEYNSENPGESGWKLAGDNFTADRVTEMIGGKMPAFVFSNACQSARTEEWKDGDFSMVNAFLTAGVAHYLGTFWKIMDEPGGRFASDFYGHLLSGKTIGESVRLSRNTAIDTYGSDSVGWASYLLYGDPTVRYFPAGQTDETAEKHGHAREKRRPGTALRESGDTANGGKTSRTGSFPAAFRNTAFALMVIVALAFTVVYGLNTASPPGKESTPENLAAKVSKPRTAPDPETIRLMAQMTAEKNARIDKLVKELESLTGSPIGHSSPAAPDGWSSAPISMAMVFGSQTSFSRRETESLVSHAIQSAIREACPRIRLLHRQSFDKILRELVWEKPEKTNLKIPDLFLYLEMNHAESIPLVLMQLARKQTGENIGVFIEPYDFSKPISFQKKNIAKNLLAALNSSFPLQGVIAEAGKDRAVLNIGDDSGVRVGRKFKIMTEDGRGVLDKNAILTVTSTASDTSVADLENGRPALREGMKVKSFMY